MRRSGRVWGADRLHAQDANGPIDGSHLSVRADAVQPGDYLPPQPCLDPTAWQDSGFRVGPSASDVCLNPPLLPTQVLLFGPLGVLEALTNSDQVTVVRATADRTHRAGAPTP
jgi:hypothetical protein